MPSVIERMKHRKIINCKRMINILRIISSIHSRSFVALWFSEQNTKLGDFYWTNHLSGERLRSECVMLLVKTLCGWWVLWYDIFRREEFVHTSVLLNLWDGWKMNFSLILTRLLITIANIHRSIPPTTYPSWGTTLMWSLSNGIILTLYACKVTKVRYVCLAIF